MNKKQIMQKIKSLDSQIDKFLNLKDSEKLDMGGTHYSYYYDSIKGLMREAVYWRLRLK